MPPTEHDPALDHAPNAPVDEPLPRFARVRGKRKLILVCELDEEEVVGLNVVADGVIVTTDESVALEVDRQLEKEKKEERKRDAPFRDAFRSP